MMKPATPLPWVYGTDRAGRHRIFGPDGIECARALWKVVKTKAEREQNARYIAHACTTYPALVAHILALEDHLKRGAPAIEGRSLREQQRVLLAKLGEVTP